MRRITRAVKEVLRGASARGAHAQARRDRATGCVWGAAVLWLCEGRAACMSHTPAQTRKLPGVACTPHAWPGRFRPQRTREQTHHDQ